LALWPLARRQCFALKTRLQQFLAAALSVERRIPDARNSRRHAGIVSSTRWEETTMRWKISPHGHDPRQIDLLAVVALLIIIVSAYVYYAHSPEPPSTTAFIVPSQSTHW
jgi:hypothetical protein